MAPLTKKEFLLEKLYIRYEKRKHPILDAINNARPGVEPKSYHIISNKDSTSSERTCII